MPAKPETPAVLTVKQKQEMAMMIVKNLLELGGHVRVNEDGIVSFANTPNDPINLILKNDKTPHPLVAYNVNNSVPNAAIINPFMESIGEDPTIKVWFQNLTNKVHTTVFSRILEFLVESAAKAANNVEITNEYVIHVLSGIVGSADQKTSAEFAKLVKEMPEFDGGIDENVIAECSLITENPKPLDFVSICVQKNERRAFLKTFLQDDEAIFKKKFGSRIRKKTWALIEAVFAEIYCTTNFSKPIIDVTVEDRTCPSFVAYINVLIQSWNRFIPYLQFIYDDAAAELMIQQIVYLESCMPYLSAIADVTTWARNNYEGTVQLNNGQADPTMDPSNSVSAAVPTKPKPAVNIQPRLLPPTETEVVQPKERNHSVETEEAPAGPPPGRIYVPRDPIDDLEADRARRREEARMRDEEFRRDFDGRRDRRDPRDARDRGLDDRRYPDDDDMFVGGSSSRRPLRDDRDDRRDYRRSYRDDRYYDDRRYRDDRDRRDSRDRYYRGDRVM